MSTIYFQYTEGKNGKQTKKKTIEQKEINFDMDFIRENKIMIPKHVKIPEPDNGYKKYTFQEYLNPKKSVSEPKKSVSKPKEVAKLNKDDIDKVKICFKDKFEEMLNKNETYSNETFIRDMAKISGYVLKNNRYKTAKEKNKTTLKFIENIKKHPLQNPITISLYVIEDKEYKLVDGKNQEVKIDKEEKEITVKYDSNLSKIITSLHTLETKLPEEPAEITLETTELNNEKFKKELKEKTNFDKDSEYDILYEYFYKKYGSKWSLDKSEIDNCLNPSK
tara:strand:+ start:317 stop:1150 length:834 start_codon:yes stop_codon:yes gene_type:complete